jgi:hypothetical protein
LDIAVLAPSVRVSTLLELPASIGGTVMGQDAFFLGFPSLLGTVDQSGPNRGYPIPFIRHGVISAKSQDRFGNIVLYLDGHNNPGFSGGPVIFRNQKYDRFHVAGVVTGFKVEKLHELDSNRMPREIDIWGNSGIVRAIEISAVIKAIERNPIGVQLTR